MNDTIVLDGVLSLVIPEVADFSIEIVEQGEVGVITALREGYPEYEGQTTIVPSFERQTLPTAMRSVLSDIVIEPIPQNYGLITWNGSTITVS